MSAKLTSLRRLSEAVSSAVLRAARDRGASIAVYTNGDDTYVKALPASPPPGAKLHCVAQFWSDSTDDVRVQVRYPGGESEFRSLLPSELEP